MWSYHKCQNRKDLRLLKLLPSEVIFNESYENYTFSSIEDTLSENLIASVLVAPGHFTVVVSCFFLQYSPSELRVLRVVFRNTRFVSALSVGNSVVVRQR